MDKINRIAANFGIDEAHRRGGAGALEEDRRNSPDDAPVEADGEGADLAGALEFMGEASALETSPAESEAGSGFFYLNRS